MNDTHIDAWVTERFETYEQLFGQCDNCLRSMKALTCQIACDYQTTLSVVM
jgi:hypothetical protein